MYAVNTNARIGMVAHTKQDIVSFNQDDLVFSAHFDIAFNRVPYRMVKRRIAPKTCTQQLHPLDRVAAGTALLQVRAYNIMGVSMGSSTL